MKTKEIKELAKKIAQAEYILISAMSILPDELTKDTILKAALQNLSAHIVTSG